MMLKGKTPYFILGLYFVILLVVNYNFQDRIVKAEGKGYDGIHYYEITEQITKNEPIATAEPFCYRIGTPYLATFLPFSIFTNFLILNQIAALLSCLLLFYWLGHFIRNKKINLLLVLFLMSSWIFYIRFNQFYPMSCDPVAFLFVVCFLNLTQSLKNKFSLTAYLFFLVSSFLAVFFREFLIIFSFSLLCLYNPIDKKQLFFIQLSKIKPTLTLFIPAFAIALLGIYISHQLVNPTTSGYSFSGALYRWAHNKSFYALISSAFNSLGIWLIFPFLLYKNMISFYLKNQYLLVLTIISFLICWLTGADNERFFTWFSPVYLLAIGVCIEKNLAIFRSKLLWIPIAIISILSLRILQPIPQPIDGLSDFVFPVFETFHTEYLNLFASHANQKVMTVVFLQYLLGCVYFYFAIRYLKTKKN